MNLSRLIESLKEMRQDAIISYGFGSAHSYRGYYDQLAFTPKKDAVVSEMLGEAVSALGATFEGYKGGDYVMDEGTPTHIANRSEWGDCAISDWLAEYWKKEAGQ